MRVYHLIKGLGRGGAEMLLPAMIRATPRDRATFRVGYFLPWKDALVPTLEGLGVPTIQFGGTNNPRILSQVGEVAEDVKRWRADLIHCHLPVTGAVGRMAGKLAGVPVVYTEHNLQERYHWATGMLNKGTWGLQQHAIACSEEVRNSIVRKMGERVPVTTVLNGVSTQRFSPDPDLGARHRASLGIAPDAPVMGTVAVFRDQKRLDAWLHVAAGVLKQRPEARFFLVGDGPLRPLVEQTRSELGLNDAVLLPGLIEDVRPWLAAMDVYTMTSKFEGLPIALLEAMACGIAPACTSVGGIPQVITSGENGRLRHQDDWRDLADDVLALFDDPTVGLRARATVEEHFSVEAMTSKLMQVYGSVLPCT